MNTEIDPKATLNPPDWITPEFTHSPHYRRALQLPGERTDEERAAYREKVDWFHKARYGLAFHFLADMGENRNPHAWASEEWNACVDAVDVEKVADQALELGAGYVAITIGQNCLYYGRWDPLTGNLWHVFLFLGSNWGISDLGHSTESTVAYAEKVIKGGGVITFDVGTRGEGEHWPRLEIPEIQMEQLRTIRDSLAKIPVSDEEA